MNLNTSKMESKPEYDRLLSEDEESSISHERPNTTPKPLYKTKLGNALLFTLSISLLMNGYFFVQHILLSHSHEHMPVPDAHDSAGTQHHHSPYAHLSADLSMPWYKDSIYTDSDPKVADKAWDDINIDMGSVALDHQYVSTMNLPTAQPFPWDDDKGIYLLAGFHDMHCLKTIREWIVAKDSGLTPTEPTEHMFHCLDALRQDVMCYADDTPRYTDHTHISGVGQNRPCRSWSLLDQWAAQRSACFKYTGSHLQHNMSTTERYSYCPEGSPYAEKVKEVFGDGHGEDEYAHEHMHDEHEHEHMEDDHAHEGGEEEHSHSSGYV